jgi:hypothetical protein
MIQAQYQDLVLPSLRRLVKHQRQYDPRQRYESRFLHSVVDQLRWQGIDLPARRGPWTVGARWLQGPGRGGLPVIPLVQRANTVVMTDTWDEARRLAGLLNWCHAPSLVERVPEGSSGSERQPFLAADPAPGLRIAADCGSPRAPGVATLGARPRLMRVPRVRTPPSHLAAAQFTDRDHRVAVVGASRHGVSATRRQAGPPL